MDYENGKLKLFNIIRGHIDSAPRMIRFRRELYCVYVLCEGDNNIYVYHYKTDKCMAKGMELVQIIGTSDTTESIPYAASGIEFSPDGKHLFVTNAGINTAMIYDVDKETGLLTKNCENSLGGDYPKTVAVMPDNEHFIALNNGGNEICIFRMNYDKKYFLMDSKPIKIERPNAIFIHEL